jgi:hypothetical protein
MFNVLKYIGDSAKRILTTEDLKNLGATEDNLKSLSGNTVLTFVKGVAHDVEAGLASFIASHPTLSNEFHMLSDEEAADETEIKSPVTEAAAPGSTEPAGTTPAAESSPAETSTTESAAPAEPSPATTEVAADATTEATTPSTDTPTATA